MILIVVTYVDCVTLPMYQAPLCSQYSSVTKCNFGDVCTLVPPLCWRRGVICILTGFWNLQFEISLCCLFFRCKVLFFRGIIRS